MNAEILCPKCHAPSPQPSLFCAQCGWDLSRNYSRVTLELKGILLTLAVGLCLWGAGWSLQESRAGVKPTEAYKPEYPVASSEPDPAFDGLRNAAQAHPNDPEAIWPLATALLEKIRDSEQPSPALVLEATDVLGQLLRIDPKDPHALLSLADISFNQKVFDKSVNLYERYLAEEPNDLPARSRYASSLAFVGKTDAAIKELKEVLKIEPNNFHALAYLSITYAQTGDRAQALEVGKSALAHAPSKEAHERFNEFLLAVAAQKESAPGKAQTTAEDKNSSGGSNELAAFVKTNPVAGPKYVRFEAKDKGSLDLYFRNFPMSAMPPFAKTKFYSGIKEKVAALGLKDLRQIRFVDADSGEVLDTLTIE
ncbi:MAG: tetratricopeptide repeat protein [Deltaproteobacteria bacterium]|nr:tetratricopeptide repeat protein [Deltaproteobacteria bacterium]